MSRDNVYSIFTKHPLTDFDLLSEDDGTERVMSPKESEYHKAIAERRDLYTEQLVHAATITSDPNMVPSSAFVMITIEGNPVPVVSFANSDVMFVPNLINFLEMNIQALRAHYAQAVVGVTEDDDEDYE